MNYWYGENCDGCERINHPYAIKHVLWKKVAKKKEVYLCLYCVEKRLGRQLTKKDFIKNNTLGQPLPINNGYFGFFADLWVDRIYQRAFGDEK